MTGSRTSDALHSRRTVVVAAAGAVGGLVASALAHPGPVAAIDPNDVVLGADNSETTTTRITNTTETLSAVVGVGGPGAAAVYGIGVTVVGGDAGANDFTAGVRGDGFHGVIAMGQGGAAVLAQGSVGVDSDGSFVGVRANSVTGTGLSAVTGSGTAIRALAFGGTAFQADGPVRFSTAGLATIRAGSTSVTVNPRVDVTSSSKVLATLQSSGGSSVSVRWVRRLT